jgi:RHS repeat-associated protein
VSADAVRALPVTSVATSVNYVYTDHLDTPRVITRATDNQMVWRWENAGPFGVAQSDQEPSGLGAFSYRARFPGQLYDSETGLHYNYHRHYGPDTGTYTQSDPIGLAGGINTYSYVGGNPVNLIDPLGLSPGTEGAPSRGIGGAIQWIYN